MAFTVRSFHCSPFIVAPRDCAHELSALRTVNGGGTVLNHLSVLLFCPRDLSNAGRAGIDCWHNHDGYSHQHAPRRGRHRVPSEEHCPVPRREARGSVRLPPSSPACLPSIPERCVVLARDISSDTDWHRCCGGVGVGTWRSSSLQPERGRAFVPHPIVRQCRDREVTSRASP